METEARDYSLKKHRATDITEGHRTFKYKVRKQAAKRFPLLEKCVYALRNRRVGWERPNVSNHREIKSETDAERMKVAARGNVRIVDVSSKIEPTRDHTRNFYQESCRFLPRKLKSSSIFVSVVGLARRGRISRWVTAPDRCNRAVRFPFLGSWTEKFEKRCDS